MPRGTLIQVRRGTAAQWTTANSILEAGEAGYETDTGLLKYGDGSTVWNSLDYFVSSSGSSEPDPDTTLLGNPITAQELDYLSGVTSNVQTQLNGKAATSHSHAVADTTGLQAALDGKASTAHSHIVGDTTGLQDALDAKLPKAGGTMTGLLTLSGAPSSTLHAATKAYVDGLAVTLPVMDVTAEPYNALGDGREVHDAAITSGQTTLTSATAAFTAEDVGKIVLIDGAGANTGFGTISSVAARKPLAATITARTNSTTVTISVASQATVSSARCVFGSDDTVALQSAFTAASHIAGANIVFPTQRIFFITSGLQIIRNAGEDQIPGGGKYANIRISGYGATLISATADIDFISMTPNTYDSMFFNPVIEGLSFDGIGGVDQTGINLSTTYGLAIRDVKMRRLGIGIELDFALMGRVQNVIVDYYSKYGIYMHNTCNATVVDGMRCRPNSIALASFVLIDTDQCELRNCISEQPSQWTGSSFVCDVLFEQTTSMGGYGHGLIVSNFYSESPGATTAIFKIINDGYTVIEKFTRQFDLDIPLIDATGSTASTITCRDWSLSNAPIQAGNSWIRFKQNAANTVGWLFENMGEIARGETTNLVTNDALWIGGVIPAKITQIEPGRVASATP